MEAKVKAQQLVESFYLCMPFKDVKLTSCDEKLELIKEMELLAAKQCAIICIDEQIATINKLLDTELNNDFSLLSERGELLSVRSYIQEM
jgi:hypothetical protein